MFMGITTEALKLYGLKTPWEHRVQIAHISGHALNTGYEYGYALVKMRR